MKMTKKLIIASVVLPLTLSAAGAFAFGGKHHEDRHDECRPGSGLDRGMIRELNLTDSQKEQFKTLRQANRDEMRERFQGEPEQRGEIREARAEKLNDLLLADKFDAAKATKMAQEMSNKQVERQVEMLSKQHKMLSILTPEQKQQFVELQKERLEDCGDDMPRHKGKDRK
ncbi:CpxP family protein [Marinomonas profundimaris]|uniref:Periplasmic repressor CpxP n=1 Tax=Marinomonas profundimaris TaxID=1208321 RepID=W1RSU3_9GAMM|nr:CpxP family protein [Marinomonas profundimaris]ETI58704.1 periplasmic repressor CpxP [Marinomonas profundimaris]